ncbi:MAG TPA: dihydrolipoyllysine-residue acetyltransferase, partial [Candidatus Baltobacteraceae bacterium]|nr:dihydrolipoyllysine-residue acetyltransferase [Candidatus Baltobacteraceae bacterium]
MSAIEVRIPNIGDFKDIAVIDVLVKPGDTVKVDDPLVTLESEKAAMDIPSPADGIVQAVALKVGDKVSEGSAVLTLSGGEQTAPPAPSAPPASAPAPSANGSGGVAAASPPVAERVVELRVPDIGDFKDVPVIEVLVKAGDAVEREAPVVVLESEKASMEVPSTESGRIVSVAVKPGDKVSQGTLIGTIATAATAAVPAAPAAASAKAVAAPAQPPVAQAPAPQTEPASTQIVHASPSIRRFARELGVKLAGVRGSGPSGRVTREDVQSYVKSALAAPTPTAGAALPFTLPPWPKLDFAQFGPIENKPLTRIQKLSGPNLQRNWITIPHVTNNDEADITSLDALRQKLNAENPDAKVTILAFLIKACVAALIKFPDFNSSLDGDHLILKKYYNVGFAADTPGGLVVPVIKGADQKGVLAIANETRALAAKAREGKLGASDMSGGTFTISSLGGIGGTSFSPIINAPEVAIMGASRSAMRPLWNGRKFEPRLMLPLSLSYDHRVIDGAAAARFNAHVA